MTEISPLSCGRITVDLTAYADNWRFLRDQVSGNGAQTKCAAMVKADGYGISIEKAVPTLVAAGCQTFFVATPDEGIAVKTANNDVTVYILNGLLPGCTEAYIHHQLIPVLNTVDEIYEWTDTANNKPAALHIDTGMNRLGLREAEAKALSKNAQILSKLKLDLIMTHLACGDTPSSLMNGCQLSAFKQICDLFPGIPRSLCNSAGIFNGKAFHLDLVRPGIALYGGAALNAHHTDNPMKTVVKAEARILQIRDVKEHESIGYGAAEITSRNCRVAVISAGYADGYIRQAGSTTKTRGACAYANGHKVPLIGRVSMDLIAIDVTDVPDLKRGDFVELFGPHVNISEIASHADTIDYEFLTGLGKRYARVYKPLHS